MSFANGHFVPASMCWMQYSTTLHRKSIAAFFDAVKIHYLNTGILVYLAHIYVNCYVWPFYQCALTDIITWIGNHSHYFGEVVSAISEITAEKRHSHPSALSCKNTSTPRHVFLWGRNMKLWIIVVWYLMNCCAMRHFLLVTEYLSRHFMIHVNFILCNESRVEQHHHHHHYHHLCVCKNDHS